MYGRNHWTLCWYIAISALLAYASLPITIAKETLPEHKSPDDTYTLALHKALLFFNAQKSGKLPNNNGIPWRGDSGLNDGNTTTDVKGGLAGGYYDAGDNAKFHFPMSYAMTILSWSLIEYNHKYKAIGEYDHIRELIKWGTDYLLLTFNSSATKINQIHAQVGGSLNDYSVPDDHYCWQRPEDMDYPRPVQTIAAGPDLAGEMAAALAAASIVFRDNTAYSKKLIKGNVSYISLATNPGMPRNSKAFSGNLDLSVLSWDNKLPAAMLLLTRLRIFLNPGYPFEGMLIKYHNTTTLTMCSYIKLFSVFNWTGGGMIQLNHGRPQPLQYVSNAAFLASLFVDYMNATGAPGFFCGPNFISLDMLQRFATSQMNYILGKNPMKMSYVVGFGNKFPRHVHHRGASIPHDNKKYSCTGGWKWRDNRNPDPNNIIGAMVGGPDQFDQFRDVRTNYSYTEPTLAGNAGLVAALVSLTSSGGHGIDKTPFSQKFYHSSQRALQPQPQHRGSLESRASLHTHVVFLELCFFSVTLVCCAETPALSITIAKDTLPDTYTLGLHKALLFFNAQKSGKLPNNNGIPWRGDSGLNDGNTTTDVKGGLVGGYYDAGDNAKFHFPMSYAMTMLSWSLIEYNHKYKAIGEYDHIREHIKWGTDYLLLTFNSSATKIYQIHAQVGGSLNDYSVPDDHYCWQRPEDMDYPRPVQAIAAGPDLAGEMAAALAAASIVFRDNTAYSKSSSKVLKLCFLLQGMSAEDDGNVSYISLATHPGMPRNSKAFSGNLDLSVLNWDKKLPASMLLLTRIRIFLNPGYPYEDMLGRGMIQLNHGRPQPLPYVANAAFLASLFVDYMNATGAPGFFCGPNFVSLDMLQRFATSQMDYILGKNPMKMSYVVGFGNKFPRHVHHRGASIPHDNKKYSCTGGWKWRDNRNPDPNNIIGAMVGGPDQLTNSVMFALTIATLSRL
ncbi:hypothetical protein LWI29_021797 [Acer saccharum]|uniref:Endoglucanase n=1 Tax=Acer saccharum TaxID=4024 RepID=A0AA39VI00_ACESA|nr:hypothetical protein LWI29_021797 [Acer saccharum]